MVLPDLFIDQDSPVAMYAQAGLDANAIVAKVFEDARPEAHCAAESNKSQGVGVRSRFDA